MRTFTIRSGNFAGEHNIYDSIEAAHASGIKLIRDPWHAKGTVIGDWCRSDDGFVVQCLNKYILKNKRHVSGQYTDCYRFPMGTVYVYHRKDGTLKIKLFYTNATTTNKSALSDAGVLGKYMNAKKRMFVNLIADGISPYAAYVQSYHKGYPSNVYIQVNKLLMDPYVRKALIKEMEPIIAKIEATIKEKTGLNLTDFLVDSIVSVVTDKKASSKDRRENIKLTLALFGKQLGFIDPKQISSSQRTKEIEDVAYEVLTPPALGPVN